MMLKREKYREYTISVVYNSKWLKANEKQL